MDSNTIRLGDLLVAGDPPAKLIKAAAAISQIMHRAYEERSLSSKTSCVLSSLTVRDFLFRIGFKNAEVESVVFALRAEQDGAELHSLGIGSLNGRGVDQPGRWNGHMVAVLSGEWLIDTTLYQAVRPQWPELPGMVLCPLVKADTRFYDLDLMAGFTITPDEKRSVRGMWLHQPLNKRWRDAPDASRRRRQPIVGELVKGFGDWGNE